MATQDALLRYSFSVIQVMAFCPEPGRSCGCNVASNFEVKVLENTLPLGGNHDKAWLGSY